MCDVKSWKFLLSIIFFRPVLQVVLTFWEIGGDINFAAAFFVAGVANKNYFCWEISLLMLCIRCEACLLHSTFAFSKYFSSSFAIPHPTLGWIWCDRENCLINVLGNNLWPSSDRYCFLPMLSIMFEACTSMQTCFADNK